MSFEIRTILEDKWEDGTRPKDLFRIHIAPDPEKYVVQIISGLENGHRRVENGCAELASLLAELRPDLLYRHVDLFIENLSAEAKILRWEAVCTLGYLAALDKEKKIPSQIDTIIAFLENKSIVLQGHALRSLARIALAYPQEGARIFAAMKAAEKAFGGNKIGFVIEAVALMAPLSTLTQAFEAFVTPYEQSDISVVTRKAEKALKTLRNKPPV